MKDSGSLAEAVTALVSVLEGFDAAQRKRIIGATLALLGDGPVPSASGDSLSTTVTSRSADVRVSPKVEKWLQQNGISETVLEEVFHFGSGVVEVIASDLTGSSKRERTSQAYLLEGLRAFLETGEPKFSDDAAANLTRRFGAFDSPNHASNRKILGNFLTGSKQHGFELSQPGLRAAASLVKEIAASTRRA